MALLGNHSVQSFQVACLSDYMVTQMTTLEKEFLVVVLSFAQMRRPVLNHRTMSLLET